MCGQHIRQPTSKCIAATVFALVLRFYSTRSMILRGSRRTSILTTALSPTPRPIAPGPSSLHSLPRSITPRLPLQLSMRVQNFHFARCICSVATVHGCTAEAVVDTRVLTYTARCTAYKGAHSPISPPYTVDWVVSMCQLYMSTRLFSRRFRLSYSIQEREDNLKMC